MTSVGLYEARAKLAALVRRAQRGEKVTLTKNGEPVAQIVPCAGIATPQDAVGEILALDWELGEPVVEAVRTAREERR